jgi:hypothetical protein
MINTSSVASSNIAGHKKNMSGGMTNITTKWTDTVKKSRHMSIDVGSKNTNTNRLHSE